MRTYSKHNLSQCSRLRVLTVAAIFIIALANGFDGFGARAAMRLPEEAISLEPWLLPSTVIPAVMDTAQIQELTPPQDAPRRIAPMASPKAVAERAHRPAASRREKRALAEFMGLVGTSSEELPLMRSFEIFESCRKFVAINC